MPRLNWHRDASLRIHQEQPFDEHRGRMTTTPIDRMPPHSVEAEEALLGSILIDAEAIFRASSFLKSEDFYVVKNQWVWDACLSLHERREPIDAVTLRRELEARGQLAELGGPAYLTYLMTVVPTAIHAEGYGRIVERTALRRRLLNAASEIAQLAYEESDEIDQTIDRAEQALFGVSQRRIARDMQPIADVIRQYYDRIEYLFEHQGEPLGIPTGFIDLDKLLGGLQRSDLIIIAARPGVGKTSLILNVALNAARRFHQRVAVFSLEMSNEQIIQRLVSAETGIDSQRLRLGDLHEDEWPLFVQATSALSEALVFVDDTPSISALQLRTKARRLHAEHGLDLIIIDYLQSDVERQSDGKSRAGNQLFVALAQGPGARVECAGAGRVAAQPRGRAAQRQEAGAERPARLWLDRARCGHRHVHLSRGRVRRELGSQERGGDHYRQAPQRADGHDRTVFPAESDPVQECDEAGCGTLEVGGWRLEIGSWRLEVGGWRLEIGGLYGDSELSRFRCLQTGEKFDRAGA